MTIGTTYLAQESQVVEVRSEVIREQRYGISPSGSREERCGESQRMTM